MIYVKNDVLTAKSSKLKWNNFEIWLKKSMISIDIFKDLHVTSLITCSGKKHVTLWFTGCAPQREQTDLGGCLGR